MYLYLEKNKLFRLFLLVPLLLYTSACGFRSKDPVDVYNKKFLKEYEKEIAKKRDKHRKIAAENNIFYGYRDAPDEDINSIKLRDELNAKFLEQYRKEEYNDDIVKDIDVSYLEDNHGEYVKKVSVERPSVNKYSYFNRDTYMNKNFNYIHYDVAQVNYDYVALIKEAQTKKYNLKLETEKLKEQEKVEPSKDSIFNINNIKERFKNLFNKNK